jgi:hypothetical protein
MKTVAAFALLALLLALATASPDSEAFEDIDSPWENDSDDEMIDGAEDDDGTFDLSDAVDEAKCAPKKCWPGSQLLGNGKCSRCAIAWYNPDCDGKCKLCPDGKTTSLEGTQSVESCFCGMNTFWNLQSKKCENCPSGTYFAYSSSKPEAKSASDCLPCPAGTAAVNSKQGGGCRPCGQGLFSASPKTASCSPCPVGTIAANVGSTECTACPAGTISFNVFAAQALGRKDMGTSCCPRAQYDSKKNTCRR